MELMTRQEIAILMKVSPARVSQYKFLPAPVHKESNQLFYDEEAVMAALAAQYPEPKETTITLCIARAKKNMMLGFLAGRYDPPRKQDLYDVYKRWAKVSKPKTKTVRIKDAFNMRGKDGPASREAR